MHGNSQETVQGEKQQIHMEVDTVGEGPLVGGGAKGTSAVCGLSGFV